ncbi:hypothetical protein [Dactylosporangium matsuzakiense]|uniref:Uncharacterized protein n=1 Tax=Dactylosporangium matsuzakiense TaxID=53360 RepID=A0A9W6NIE0_9ACTN|nr:hypothetical protein [Dactylosporangium matsuzakiense]UWZ45265.1 hypothetical protein Dmats_01545 [Dactylosporangium matsuzakiense]GLK98764.1 hypothetical protein GCM10017581_005050 [Dactylosporangium matsuzakiense]
MDRHFVKALLYAWDRDEFREGLQHLIDLDEVTTLLAALSVEDHDHEVERRVLDLVRSGLDAAEIRRATLLLIEDDDVRDNVAAGITASLADRPDLARSIRFALDDPKVRTELREALESAPLRAVIWQVAENQFEGRRWALIRTALVLVVRHRHARRLTWALRRHGLIHALRSGD